jgi:hypothetical protein
MLSIQDYNMKRLLIIILSLSSLYAGAQVTFDKPIIAKGTVWSNGGALKPVYIDTVNKRVYYGEAVAGSGTDAQTLSLNTGKNQLTISNGNMVTLGGWQHYDTHIFATTIEEGTTPVIKYTMSHLPDDGTSDYWITVRMSVNNAPNDYYYAEKRALVRLRSGVCTVLNITESEAEVSTGDLVNIDFTIVPSSGKPALQVTGNGFSGVNWTARIIAE